MKVDAGLPQQGSAAAIVNKRAPPWGVLVHLGHDTGNRQRANFLKRFPLLAPPFRLRPRLLAASVLDDDVVPVTAANQHAIVKDQVAVATLALGHGGLT